MSKNRMTTCETADGRQDVGIKINGHVFLTMPQEGYQALGLSYEQAKEAATNISALILATANISTATEHIVETCEKLGCSECADHYEGWDSEKGCKKSDGDNSHD